MNLAVKCLTGLASLGLLYAGAAHAEITLLPKNNGTPYLNNLQLQAGGSVRWGASNAMGGSDDGSFNHRLADDGTRFRFKATYFLPDQWQLLAYYEVGNNSFNDLGMSHHVKDGANITDRRQLYFGVSNPEFGTLTYGKQQSVWYQTVGATLDDWVQDKKGQPAGSELGTNPNYDLGERSDGLLNYTYDFGRFKLLTELIVPQRSLYKGGYVYRRNMGGAVGGQYKITNNLTWGASYTYMKAKVHKFNTPNPDQTNYNQQLLGTSMTWTPGNWHFAGLVGYYRDYTPVTVDGSPVDAGNYFHKNARSAELFASYTFPVAGGVLTGIQPYYALSLNRWHNYDQTYNYLGVIAKFRYGFSIWLEHQFTNTSSTKPNANADISKIRLRYDF